MSNNIVPAEHIGLVSAYLVTVCRAQPFWVSKNPWIRAPLRCRNDVIIPSCDWMTPKESRVVRGEGGKHTASIEYARNMASAIAHLNELSYREEHGTDGPTHEMRERIAKEARRRMSLRGFSDGRASGQGFRNAASWFAEYYVDNPPQIKPIPLTRLIQEVRFNLASYDSGESENYRDGIHDIYLSVTSLCEKAMLHALRHSNLFTSSPAVWVDDRLYEQYRVSV